MGAFDEAVVGEEDQEVLGRELAEAGARSITASWFHLDKAVKIAYCDSFEKGGLNPAYRETAFPEGGRIWPEGLTDRQTELMATLTCSGVGSDLVDNPEEFIAALLGLVNADKAIVGFSEDDETHVPYQVGLDRESIHCRKKLHGELMTIGPGQDEGALWFPLSVRGFLGFSDLHLLLLRPRI